jgi:hypothetical protein
MLFPSFVGPDPMRIAFPRRETTVRIKPVPTAKLVALVAHSYMELALETGMMHLCPGEATSDRTDLLRVTNGASKHLCRLLIGPHSSNPYHLTPFRSLLLYEFCKLFGRSRRKSCCAQFRKARQDSAI